MDFEEYQFEARRTQRKDLPLWALREHALFGLSAEVGEVMGLHQKVHQGHPMDDNALRLELGDCLWFLAEICDVYGWTMEEIARDNIAKLRNRYKDKFTVDESVNRQEYRVKPAPIMPGPKTKHYAKGEGHRRA